MEYSDYPQGSFAYAGISAPLASDRNDSDPVAGNMYTLDFNQDPEANFATPSLEYASSGHTFESESKKNMHYPQLSFAPVHDTTGGQQYTGYPADTEYRMSNNNYHTTSHASATSNNPYDMTLVSVERQPRPRVSTDIPLGAPPALSAATDSPYSAPPQTPGSANRYPPDAHRNVWGPETQAQIMTPADPSQQSHFMFYSRAELLGNSPTSPTQVYRETVASPKVREKANEKRKNPGRYTCELCHNNFTTRHNLRFHENSHQNLKPYRCSYCEDRFTVPRSKERHEKKKHPLPDTTYNYMLK